MRGSPLRYAVGDPLPAHRLEVVQGSRVDVHPTSMTFKTQDIVGARWYAYLAA
jgi:hypothetical protein